MIVVYVISQQRPVKDFKLKRSANSMPAAKGLVSRNEKVYYKAYYEGNKKRWLQMSLRFLKELY